MNVSPFPEGYPARPLVLTHGLGREYHEPVTGRTNPEPELRKSVPRHKKEIPINLSHEGVHDPS
jgi:hypothetical protein